MRIYNYSEARQNFAAMLNLALEEEVLIKRKDGSSFKIVPVETNTDTSPLDVQGMTTKATTEDILDSIETSRAE